MPHVRPSNAWRFLRTLWLGAWLAGWALLAQAQQLAPVPEFGARVVDQSGVLDAAQRQRLEAQLAALEQRKGAQVAVLIVPSTAPETIEQYATRAFEKWKIGRDKVDDGVLLLMASDDRALRIEVGYGLEGAIPDSAAGRIINEYIVPRLRAGDWPGAVQAGVTALERRIEGEELPPPAASGRDEGSRLAGTRLAGRERHRGAGGAAHPAGADRGGAGRRGRGDLHAEHFRRPGYGAAGAGHQGHHQGLAQRRWRWRWRRRRQRRGRFRRLARRVGQRRLRRLSWRGRRAQRRRRRLGPLVGRPTRPTAPAAATAAAASG